MIPQELIKTIRRVQVRTSHLADDMLAGQYHTAFKGRGIEFEEVRPYQIGDDVRTIDWNVTARHGQPFVKLFREERELTVVLLVDLSASLATGTHDQFKRELVTELAATLAFSAVKNNDKVGLHLFTDEVEKALPPRKGVRHVLRVIRELLYCQPIGTGTNITKALEHLNGTIKRRGVVFLISDFQDEGYEKALGIARRKHDIIPVVVADRCEQDLPNAGIIELFDAETGQTVAFDTTSKRRRLQYHRNAQQRSERRDRLFKRLRMDRVLLNTGQDIVEPLRRFFYKRERRQWR